MLNSLKVLVVDDDAEVLDVVCAFLESKGYAATPCGSAQEGLETLDTDTFGLVISDIRMAGMDGFDFLRAVRGEHPSIGIILMTAYENDFPLSKALSAGADGYISKPFSLRKFSLIFEQAYWYAISREDWWDAHAAG
jgi:CheY-like chemotaxis protein